MAIWVSAAHVDAIYPCYTPLFALFRIRLRHEQHGEETPVVCPIPGCERSFKWRGSLAHHLTSKAHAVDGHPPLRLPISDTSALASSGGTATGSSGAGPMSVIAAAQAFWDGGPEAGGGGDGASVGHHVGGDDGA